MTRLGTQSLRIVVLFEDASEVKIQVEVKKKSKFNFWYSGRKKNMSRMVSFFFVLSYEKSVVFSSDAF